MARRAKLGMRVTGSSKDESYPPPGAPEFGERAKERMQRLMGRTKQLGRPDPSRDEDIRKGILIARRSGRSDRRA
jgi:hypothetical protein